MAGDKFSRMVAAGKITATEAAKRRAQSLLDKRSTPPVRQQASNTRKRTNVHHEVYTHTASGGVNGLWKASGWWQTNLTTTDIPCFASYSNVWVERVELEVTSSLGMTSERGRFAVCLTAKNATSAGLGSIVHIKGHQVVVGSCLGKKIVLQPRTGDQKFVRRDGKKVANEGFAIVAAAELAMTTVTLTGTDGKETKTEKPLGTYDVILRTVFACTGDLGGENISLS